MDNLAKKILCPLLVSVAHASPMRRDVMESITGVKLPLSPDGEFPSADPLVEILSKFTSSEEVETLQTMFRDFVGKSVGREYDVYTFLNTVIQSGVISRWESTYYPDGRPTASDVPVPTTEDQLVYEPIECGLAYNEEANAVIVPRGPEVDSDFLVFVSEAIAKASGFPLLADKCGEWEEGEDKVDTIRRRLLGIFPDHRVQVPWGPDLLSDRALEEFIFDGMGQHRVQRVCTQAAGGLDLAACEGRGEDPNAPLDAYYAVYMDYAEGLEVREGFAKLGANAYFDREGRVLSIYRLGTSYFPNGPQGEAATVPVCSSNPWYFFKQETCTEPTPAVVGWQQAKMAFRGTLNAVVTVIDHLYGIHLAVANSIITGNLDVLEPNDPLRRLLTPFGYRTARINFQSSFALVNEFGLIHRATPLTTKGLTNLFDFARTSASGLTWQPLSVRHAIQGVDTLSLPLHEDGGDYYQVVQSFVRKYLAKYYPDDSCASSDSVQAWHRRANGYAPNHDLPEITNCEDLETILSTFMYYVSAAHRYVGTIAESQEDPCFAPWAWKEGELCGLPRTFQVQALTMSVTGIEQPRILDDYTHLFLDDEAKGIWTEFADNLKEFDARVDERNLSRRKKFVAFDVDFIETSVAI